jgi:hypothetical protein
MSARSITSTKNAFSNLVLSFYAPLSFWPPFLSLSLSLSLPSSLPSSLPPFTWKRCSAYRADFLANVFFVACTQLRITTCAEVLPIFLLLQAARSCESQHDF